MAELAMLGLEHRCYEEAQAIADWLQHVEQKVEAACAIRVFSAVVQGHCEEALLLEKAHSCESLSPWYALCELRLGMRKELALRLGRLLESRDPQLVQFARDMRISVAI